ncbi:MAG: sister chromatid cohesion protein PDS5 [Roseivirga sp.]
MALREQISNSGLADLGALVAQLNTAQPPPEQQRLQQRVQDYMLWFNSKDGGSLTMQGGGAIEEYTELALIDPNSLPGNQQLLKDYFNSLHGQYKRAQLESRDVTTFVQALWYTLLYIDPQVFDGDPSPLIRLSNDLLEALDPHRALFSKAAYPTHRATLYALHQTFVLIRAVSPSQWQTTRPGGLYRHFKAKLEAVHEHAQYYPIQHQVALILQSLERLSGHESRTALRLRRLGHGFKGVMYLLQGISAMATLGFDVDSFVAGYESLQRAFAQKRVQSAAWYDWLQALTHASIAMLEDENQAATFEEDLRAIKAQEATLGADEGKTLRFGVVTQLRSLALEGSEAVRAHATAELSELTHTWRDDPEVQETLVESLTTIAAASGQAPSEEVRAALDVLTTHKAPMVAPSLCSWLCRPRCYSAPPDTAWAQGRALLHYGSYLATTHRIPFPLVQTLLGTNDEPSLRAVVASLQDRGLATELRADEDAAAGLQLAPGVQAACRLYGSQEEGLEKKALLTRLVEELARTHWWAEGAASYAPHVAALLSVAHKELEAQVSLGRLSAQMGQYSAEVGQNEEALTYHSQALATRQTLYGDRVDMELADSLYNVGAAQERLERDEGALDHHERALAMRQRHYEATDHHEVVESLQSVVRLCERLAAKEQASGRGEEAFVHYTRALEVKQMLYGDQPHQELAQSFHSLGVAQESLERYEEALKHHELALAMRQTLYGQQTHAEVAQSLYSLGVAYEGLANDEEALKHHKQALSMRQELYQAANHPEVVQSLRRVGNLYQRLGKIQEQSGDPTQALAHYEQALEARRTLHGDQLHAELAQSFHSLGIVQERLGNDAEALGHHEQALATQRALHPEVSHVELAQALHNVGAIHEKLEDYPKALAHYEQALAMQQALHGEQAHEEVAQSFFHTGVICYKLERYAEALGHHEQALTMRQRLYAENHLSLAQSLYSVGLVQDRLGDSDKALEHYRPAMPLLATALRSDQTAVRDQAVAFFLAHKYEPQHEATTLLLAEEMVRRQGKAGLEQLLGVLHSGPQAVVGLQDLLLQLRCVEAWLQTQEDAKEGLAALEEPYHLEQLLVGWWEQGFNCLSKDRLDDKLLKVLTDALPSISAVVGASASVLQPLLRALEDSEEDVRYAAVEALGALVKATPYHAEHAREALILAIGDSDVDVRRAAVEALGALVEATPEHAEHALKALTSAIRNSESHVRSGAVEALGALVEAAPQHAEAVLEALTSAMEDSEWHVRRAAVEALGALVKAAPYHAEAVLEALIRVLRDSDSDIRRAVAEALGELVKAAPEQAEHALKALTSAMEDSDWLVRRAAARALGALVEAAPLQAEAVRAALTSAMEDSDSDVRSAAARALGALVEAAPAQAEHAREALILAIRDSNGSVRRDAAYALGALAEHAPLQAEHALKALTSALEDSESLVRRDATKALGALAKAAPAHAEHAREALTSALRDSESHVRIAAAQALVALAKAAPAHAEHALKALTSTLRDSDWYVRIAAAKALGALAEHAPLHAEPALKVLIAAREDSSGYVRHAASEALETFSSAQLTAYYLATKDQCTIPWIVARLYRTPLVVQASHQPGHQRLVLYPSTSAPPVWERPQEEVQRFVEAIRAGIPSTLVLPAQAEEVKQEGR